MKKYLVSIAFIFLLGQSNLFCQQNVGQFINNFSNVDGVEKVKIGGFWMSLIKLSGKMDGVPVLKGVKGIEVYTLDDNSNEKHKQFQEEIKFLKDDENYQTLLRVKDGGDDVKIVFKKDGNKIREIIIFCMEETESTIIRLKGKISEKELSKLMDGQVKLK
ncbi:MAG: DUF4252 domain-containing protein [Dysgonamonadaceae bacterium]|jgi:S-adenosylhomocysteine hydrolase|nr:DUF4252 domain-containing protein [Dysgonamonadaceae bacterium]